jgi:LPS-assembly lipoprotein
MLAGLGWLLAGCGFSPLYARGESGRPSPVVRELGAVSVDVIGERPGQLLRQALQQRLEGDGSSTSRRYALSVSYGISGEGIGVRQDTIVTRLRLIGRASWALRAEDPAQTVLTRDQAQAVDDVNIFNEQYFALDLENEAAQRRIAETIADHIVSQLAAYFRRRSNIAMQPV